MRPLERVQRTRRALAVAVVSRAMLLAVAAGSLAATATLFAARTSGAAGSALPWLAAIVVGGAVAAVAMRGWVRLTVPRVALWVEDQGPGLPEMAGRSLFGRFVRSADDHEPEQSGTGLGLWIAQSIVERHGGAIESERVAERTRITLRLPLAARQPDPHPEAKA